MISFDVHRIVSSLGVNSSIGNIGIKTHLSKPNTGRIEWSGYSWIQLFYYRPRKRKGDVFILPICLLVCVSVQAFEWIDTET